MLPLKQGARLGNYYCYGQMAVIFAADRHTANFAKAWDLFFAHREQAYLAELEGDPRFFTGACTTYIRSCLLQRLQPGHVPLLIGMGETIIATVLRDLDQARAGSAERREIARMRDSGEVPDEIFRRIQYDLDLANELPKATRSLQEVSPELASVVALLDDVVGTIPGMRRVFRATSSVPFEPS